MTSSRRFSAEWLDEITGISEKWRRRCNGRPVEGILVGRAELRAVLASSSAVTPGPDGVISWRANGRVFTAEPVREGAPETAVLLNYGVTVDTRDALDRAGITTLAQLAGRDRGQIADIPNIGFERAEEIMRALGRLIDVGRSTK